MGRSVRIILFFCCFLPLFAGCGKKTSPVPPHVVIPVPIIDLKQNLDDSSSTLSWTYPKRSESGESIDSIRYFQLWKSEVVEADYCPECPVQYGVSIKLDAAGVKSGSKLRYIDNDLKVGHRYTYKVISHSGWNIVSGDSNKVFFRWESPLAAPEGLTVESLDQQLIIRWQQVATLADGSPVTEPVLYQLYRSSDGKAFSSIGGLVSGVEYVDKGLRNNTKFYYKVRAMRNLDGTELSGRESEVVSGKPRDLTPPVPPHKFTVLAVEGGVKILWESIGEKDVVGYRIYRRSASSQNYALVGETSVSSFSFIDRNLPEGSEILYYAVTAFDKADPPNESEFSLGIEFVR